MDVGRYSIMRNKNVVLIGNNHFSLLIKKFIQLYADYSVVAFSVNERYKTRESLDGIEVVDFEIIEEKYPPDEYDALIAVGYKQMNKIRQNFYQEAKAKGYKLKNFIHPTSIIETENIGEGNIVLENSLLSINAVVGNCNLIWDNVAVRHDVCVGSFNQISGHSSISGFASIGNNCFLGTNCIIEPEIEIADFTLIGAGAHIKAHTDKYGVYVPTKTLKIPGKSIDFF